MKAIIEQIFTHAAKDPNHVALQMKGEPGITYRDLEAKAIHVKGILSPYIDKPGARVILLGASSPDWIVAFLGINLAGATVVPIDPNLEEAHIEKLILRSEPHALFISEEALKKFSSRLVTLCPTMVMEDNFKSINTKNTISYTLSDQDPEVAALLFTSGTTGDYKGVLLSQKGFDQAISAAQEAVPLKREDVIMCVLPAHHIFGLVCVLLVPLSQGATIVFIKKLQGPEMLDAMQTYRPTVLVGVPRLLELLYGRITGQVKSKGKLVKGIVDSLLKVSSWFYSLGRLSGIDINVGKVFFGKVHHTFGGRLRLIVSGGAPLSKKLYMFFSSLGFTVIEGYGMTETTALISANRHKTRMPGTVGEIVPGMELKVFNQNEKGEGEICVRGCSVTLGYYRDEQTTARSQFDDWFRTGDLGYLDEKRRLVITGRIKEMIILPSGKNISPDHVEQHYQDIASVQELAVFGSPISSGSLEEEIHAAVVINPEDLAASTPDTVKQGIRAAMSMRAKTLPSWWQIKRIHFVESLPKTTTMKVKRQLLKEHTKRNEDDL